MSRPYRLSAAHRAGAARAHPRRRGSVGTVACQCRRRRAPPQRSRPRLLRRRLAGADRGAQPLAQPRAFADNDEAADLPQAFELAAAPEGRRHFVTFDGVFYQADVWLDGAYLGDPEGYFFPHAFDITEPVAAGHRARAGRRGGLPAATEPQDEAHHHRRVPELGRDGSRPGTRAVCGGRCGSKRPGRFESTGGASCAAMSTTPRAHLRLHARLDSDVARTVRVRTRIDGELLDQHEQSLAGGLNEVDWNLDIDDPRLWWPWTLGDQELTDVEVEISVDDVISDTRTVRTGLREVRAAGLGLHGQRRADVREGRQPGADPNGVGRRDACRVPARCGVGPRRRSRPAARSRAHLATRAVRRGRRAWHVAVAGLPVAVGIRPHDSQRGGAPGTRGRRPTRPSSIDRGVVRAQRTGRAEP